MFQTLLKNDRSSDRKLTQLKQPEIAIERRKKLPDTELKIFLLQYNTMENGIES